MAERDPITSHSSGAGCGVPRGVNERPRADDRRSAEEADPWVIALAEAVSATTPTLFDARSLGIVVSEEAKVGGIADICRRRGAEHMDFAEMLTTEGLSFSTTSAI